MDKNTVIKYLKEREFPEEIKNNEIYLDKISSAITDMYIGKNVLDVGLELDKNIVIYENVRGFVLKKSDYDLQNDIEKAGNGETLDKESFVLQEDGLHVEKIKTSTIGNDEIAIPAGIREETTIDKNGVENVRTETRYTGLESSLQTAKNSRITGLSTMSMDSTIEIRRNKDLGTAYVVETRNNNITAKDMMINSSNIDHLNVVFPYSISTLKPEELETYYTNVENAISNISNPITRNSMQERLARVTNKQSNLNQGIEQQAEAMVNQMAQGIDVLGENQNQQEISNGKQMGFTAIWLLGLVTGIVSAGILILGAVLLK